jgi:hypothetical protein
MTCGEACIAPLFKKELVKMAMNLLMPALRVKSIVVNTTVIQSQQCRGIYIGTSADYDFSFDGTNWTTFKGCIAGTILPFRCVGARITAGAANPNAGDIVFLY